MHVKLTDKICMITIVNNSPTLRLLLILDKRLDYSRPNLRTRNHHKIIPSYACTTGFKVSTMKLWVVEEWNSLKQITIFCQSSHLEKHFKIFFLKTKHSLPSPFYDTLKSLCIYGIFGSSPRHGCLCLLFTYS